MCMYIMCVCVNEVVCVSVCLCKRLLVYVYYMYMCVFLNEVVCVGVCVSQIGLVECWSVYAS